MYSTLSRTRVSAPVAHHYRALLALALLSPLAPLHAAGLGGYEVQSALGQPLRMVVQITTRADEVVEPGCFRLNPYTVASDGLPQLTGAQVTLEKRGNQQRLIVTSARAILDPIVRVSIDVGCDTTLRRDLTLLLDPLPAIETQAQTSEPVRPAVAPAAAATRPASAPPATDESARASDAGAAPGSPGSLDRTPDTTAQPAAASARAPAPARSAAVASAPRAPRALGAARRSELQPAPQRVPAAAERQSAARPRVRPPQAATQASRDRLTISTSGPPLDSYVGAPISPRLTLSTSMADRTGQPPLSEAALAILRQKQARLKSTPNEEDIPSLEAELVVLQKRTAEMRSQLDAVVAQLASLQSAPSALAGAAAAAVQPPVGASTVAATPVRALPPEPPGGSWSLTDPRLPLFAALGGLLLLLIVVFGLWLRRERSYGRQLKRWNKSPYVPVTAPAPPPRASPGADAGRFERAASAAERAPPQESYAFSPFSSAHAARDVGVSDLAQATEKASVFATLGRPEQAIDVLRDHIDHEPKPSPMAWLMLLDLYRQTGRRSDFDAVSQRFHVEFNTETPAWVQPSPADDPGLAAFPWIVEKIRGYWANQPGRAYIEELLYDNRGGSRIGFSLATFRDLLLLHGLIEQHLLALEAPAAIDPESGERMDPPPPAPPPHLAKLWNATPGAEADSAPPAMQQPALQLDVGLLSDASERSALETGYPIIAEAITMRWNQPGVANYLSNLIRTTNENHGPTLSVETISELILLHDVAQELGDPEPNLSLA